jgi:hypothetical protein
MDGDAVRTFRSGASTGSAAFLAGFIDSDLGATPTADARPAISAPLCWQLWWASSGHGEEPAVGDHHGCAGTEWPIQQGTLVDLDAVLTMKSVVSS